MQLRVKFLDFFYFFGIVLSIVLFKNLSLLAISMTEREMRKSMKNIKGKQKERKGGRKEGR